MSAIRQDAWTSDDDLILAEVTLRHIREGGTQLAAFEEVGERIGRTAAACGFRWNSCVRKKYETAIQIAKAQRKKRSHVRPTVKVEAEIEEFMPDSKGEADETITMDTVIRYLRQWKNTQQEYTRQIKQLTREIQEKQEELDVIRNENRQLKQSVNSVETDYRLVNDDYKALIQIMERARKLAFLAEEEEQKTRFKMDANGNLERID